MIIESEERKKVKAQLRGIEILFIISDAHVIYSHKL
jgi:hypothetical protein